MKHHLAFQFDMRVVTDNVNGGVQLSWVGVSMHPHFRNSRKYRANFRVSATQGKVEKRISGVSPSIISKGECAHVPINIRSLRFRNVGSWICDRGSSWVIIHLFFFRNRVAGLVCTCEDTYETSCKLLTYKRNLVFIRREQENSGNKLDHK